MATPATTPPDSLLWFEAMLVGAATLLEGELPAVGAPVVGGVDEDTGMLDVVEVGNDRGEVEGGVEAGCDCDCDCDDVTILGACAGV